MTPEQETTLLTSVARIDERTHSIKVTMDRHEGSINTLHSKTNENSKALSRIRGIGLGVSGVFGVIMAFLGLDTFGG